MLEMRIDEGVVLVYAEEVVVARAEPTSGSEQPNRAR